MTRMTSEIDDEVINVNSLNTKALNVEGIMKTILRENVRIK
jgi:hypothetical protein